MMRGGKLRTVIDIQRRVQIGVDRDNAPNFEWQTWVQTFADVIAKRGREHFDPGTRQRFSEEVFQFTVRWSEVEGLDASMRIVDDNGAVFDIKAILPDVAKQSDCLIECTLQDSVVGRRPLLGSLKESVPGASVGVAYEGFSVSAEGGTAPYAYSVGSGSLPTGLSIGWISGEVLGTPTAAGVKVVRFLVQDSNGDKHLLPPVTITVSASDP